MHYTRILGLSLSLSLVPIFGQPLAKQGNGGLDALRRPLGFSRALFKLGRFSVDLGRGTELRGSLTIPRGGTVRVLAKGDHFELEPAWDPVFSDLSLHNGNKQAKLYEPEQPTIMSNDPEGRTKYFKFMIPSSSKVTSLFFWPGPSTHQQILDLLHTYHHEPAYAQMTQQDKEVMLGMSTRKMLRDRLSEKELAVDRRYEALTNQHTLKRIDFFKRQGVYPFGDVEEPILKYALDILVEHPH